MKKLIPLILLLVNFSLKADEVIVLPAVAFDLKTGNALEKLQDTLLNPENFLRRYRPGGAKIEKMSVDRGQFQFLATKKVLMISKSVFVHSYFDVSSASGCNGKLEQGYLAKMDLAGSDGMLTENIEKYESLICARETSPGNLHIRIEAKLYKGSSYNSVIGPIISDMIAAQTNPLIEAISAEVMGRKY